MSEEKALLEVEHLSVGFLTEFGEVQAVRDVSFSVKKGECLAIVGESGSGKSAICRAIMKLLPEEGHIRQGRIVADGTDITEYCESQMKRLRGSLFSMVFQNPLDALNPAMTVGAQIGEAVAAHEPHMSFRRRRERIQELMELVGIDNPKERSLQYGCQLSGGMRQRIVLACALAGRPKLLFADEPTTALDMTVQAQILALLREVRRRFLTAVVFVTHDLSVARQTADYVAVMYAGKIVEIGTAAEIFENPGHPYTWGLMRSLPAFSEGKKGLYAIPGMPPSLVNPPPGDAFACRNEYALAIDYEEEPPMFWLSDTHGLASWLADRRAPKIVPPPGIGALCGCEPAKGADRKQAAGVAAAPREAGEERSAVCTAAGAEPGKAGGRSGREGRAGMKARILLDVRHVTKDFSISKRQSFRALDDVSLDIREGEIFGLVGESGSGKSTLARLIMRIDAPDAGEIFFDGIPVCGRKEFRRNRRFFQTGCQMIFQDSGSSLNPRMKVAEILAEPFHIQKLKPKRGSLREEADFLLKYVGMEADFLDRYPQELSGGQRQRVAIARALATEPKLVIADEAIASLDVSIQAQIVNLFGRLQKEQGFSFLFIAHDLRMVKFLCDRVGVMYRGRLVETGPTPGLFADPAHEYTKRLLSFGLGGNW